MLQTMHAHLNSRIPIYGMNRGSIGFLLNDYHEDNLKERSRLRRPRSSIRCA
jgi:NAD+ kinase